MLFCDRLATDATVVLFTDDQISAIEVSPWSIMTYSFFPKLGTAFIGQQGCGARNKSKHNGIGYFRALSIFLDQPKR
jgi:hypothetical protein